VKEKVPDYSGFPIKKLPPGRAHGADSLTRWALGNKTKTQMRVRKTPRRRRPSDPFKNK
jgi:hypothetical protein